MQIREATPDDLVALAELLAEINNPHAEALPEVYQRVVPSGETTRYLRRILDAEEFQSRKFRLLSRKPEMRVPAQVPGGFVEVNLSAESCVGLATRLVEFCGLDPATVRYEVR